MTIFKLSPGDVESFSISTNPIRTYSSSSVSGSTGSVHVFARRSPIEKLLDETTSGFIDSSHGDDGFFGLWESTVKTCRTLRRHGATSSAKFNEIVGKYVDTVNEQPQVSDPRLNVFRFTPSFNFTRNTVEKLFVKNVLNGYYRDVFPSANWAYTNYNSLNFFTASTVNDDAVLLYPNVDGGSPHQGFASGTYSLSGAFSFDFFINPRYTSDGFDGQFKAGTIFHLSSSYAVSLISGSAKDHNGRPSRFRIQLQLSNSADIAPSIATNDTSPANNLTFLSDDNSLVQNKWQRVIVRWGTSLINDGTGSFIIDGVERGVFVIPSGTVAQSIFNQAKVLCVGNYYEGSNDPGLFLSADPALRDGLVAVDGTPGVEAPDDFSFAHPLNAEVHDLMIKRYYMTDNDIQASASKGPDSIDPQRIAFYLPPYFTQESPFRQIVGDHGGVPQTPFFETDGLTNDPFNVAMSFGVGGHYINLENFVRDFASNVYPRLHHLTCSVLQTTSELRSANSFLYDQKPVVKRNMLIMPCDDGNYVPNFSLLLSESHNQYSVDVQDLSIINLDDLIGTGSLLISTDFSADGKTDEEAFDFVNQLVGFTPEQPGISPGSAFNNYVRSIAKAVSAGSFDPGVQANAPLAIYNRTKDASSNQVVFFDMSNLFYGDRIMPGSFSVVDRAMSGSSGVVRVTLRDDGRGNIYRADSDSSHATWNSVGNIYYDEGIVVVKSPHLFFFGQEGYEMTFRGDRNVHVMKIDAIAPAGMLNSSSNPTYQKLPPSGNANDPDKEFTWISSINFHDDNLNVIMKAQLAQPFKKRLGTRVRFNSKIDF